MERVLAGGLFYILFVLADLLSGGSAVCNANSPNKAVFQEINSTQWDRNWSDISEDGKRPLGFMKGTVYFSSNNPNPCVEIPDTNTRHVHIQVESPTGSTIWLKDHTGAEWRCDSTVNGCPLAKASTMYYEFFLDTARGSSESDVSFWYKFTKGPTSADDPEEMWCGTQQDEFPSSLQPLPTNLPFPSSTGPVGSAAYVCLSTLLILCAVMLSFAFI